MKPVLLVCSNSTKDFFPDIQRKHVVKSASNKDILKLLATEDKVVAVGGGAVIDTAKILSKNPIECYPTTASGSSATSWSVYWDGSRKHSCRRILPREPVFKEEFYSDLPDSVLNDTTCDVLSHCLDSLYSVKKTEESAKYCEEALGLIKTYEKSNIIKAGHIAGKAIEITGTNLLHSLSYPLTGHFGISHGTALGFYMNLLWDHYDGVLSYGYNIKEILNPITKDIDFNNMVKEAFTYDKMEESLLNVTEQQIIDRIKL